MAPTATAVAIVAFSSDLLTAWLLARVWGRASALGYLLLGTPLLVFMYLRLDGVSVALAVAGFALVRRERPTAGGLAIAGAALVRLWPAALIPFLLVRRRLRAFAVAMLGLVAGSVAWVAWGGWAAPVRC